METPEEPGRPRPDARGRVIPFVRATEAAHARRLAALKRRIEEGSYDPDPELIARALLDSDLDFGQ